MLTIALPSGKSLEARTCELFRDANIEIIRKGTAHRFESSHITILSGGSFVKPRRIPFLVANDYFDVGITGKDTVLESGESVTIYTELPYSRTTFGATKGVLFAHVDDLVNSPHEISNGATILSEYPALTRSFFENLGKVVKIETSPGSVEAEVPMVYRFGVVLSETGKSLRENNLKEIATIFESNTVLVANASVFRDERKVQALHLLKLMLHGALTAHNCRFAS